MPASSLFLRTAVVAALFVMILGAGMGMKELSLLAAMRAHLNLISWMSMFLFGLFYRVEPNADNELALVHYAVSVTGLVFSLSLPFFDLREVLSLWAGAVLLTIASMALFTWNVFTATRAPRSEPPAPVENLTWRQTAQSPRTETDM